MSVVSVDRCQGHLLEYPLPLTLASSLQLGAKPPPPPSTPALSYPHPCRVHPPWQTGINADPITQLSALCSYIKPPPAGRGALPSYPWAYLADRIILAPTSFCCLGWRRVVAPELGLQAQLNRLTCSISFPHLQKAHLGMQRALPAGETQRRQDRCPGTHSRTMCLELWPLAC